MGPTTNPFTTYGNKQMQIVNTEVEKLFVEQLLDEQKFPCVRVRLFINHTRKTVAK